MISFVKKSLTDQPSSIVSLIGNTRICMAGNYTTSFDPLDVDQWEFHVLPARVLDEKVTGQKSIALSSLLKLGPTKVGSRD